MKTNLILLNGCKATNPSVTPKNWKTGGKKILSRDWIIHFYFKDPNFSEKYPNGKQIRIKGMNEFKTLGERREATEILLDGVINKLVNLHWNPITKTYMEGSNSINQNITLLDALEYYRKIKNVSSDYKADIKSMIKKIEPSLNCLQLQFKNVNHFTRRDIRSILRHQQQNYNLSNNRYNKYKVFLSSLFDDMIEDEILEYNPCYKIKKLPTEKKLREILTEEQRKEVYYHLKSNYYTFWRFMMIFYSSGSRIAELLNVKVKDVNLKKLEFKVMIKKGQQFKEVLKPINKQFAHLWTEVITEQVGESFNINPNHYIFSRGLFKGDKPIRRDQLTRRWRVHVKEKLNITADFYSLKHLYSDQITEKLDMQHAQKLNSHTTIRMVEKHYAVNEETRKINRLKNIETDFYIRDNPDNTRENPSI